MVERRFQLIAAGGKVPGPLFRASKRTRHDVLRFFVQVAEAWWRVPHIVRAWLAAHGEGGSCPKIISGVVVKDPFADTFCMMRGKDGK